MGTTGGYGIVVMADAGFGTKWNKMEHFSAKSAPSDVHTCSHVAQPQAQSRTRVAALRKELYLGRPLTNGANRE
jgi:hypothetical protein